MAGKVNPVHVDGEPPGRVAQRVEHGQVFPQAVAVFGLVFFAPGRSDDDVAVPVRLAQAALAVGGPGPGPPIHLLLGVGI